MDDSQKLKVIKEMITRMRPPGELDLTRDRARYDSAADVFRSYVKSSISVAALNGVQCEVHAPPRDDLTGCVIYFHGGGYVLGSPKSHRHLAAEICRLTRCVVVVPDYALAPKHPFPAARNDALRVYQAVRDRWPHLAIGLAGDSAGGALAVSIAAQECGKEKDRIRAIACLSPWMDLTCTSDRYENDAVHDPSLDSRRLRMYAQQYLGTTSPENPLASPLFASLGHLPPILVQVGRDELLYEDAVGFTKNVQQAGGDVALDVWDDVVHVWQWYWPMLEAGNAAIARVSTFLLIRLTSSGVPLGGTFAA